ncbi:MAG: HAMP domain-containing histidine kinase [Actinobacteria bacterium]|nr:HAMP domain-containing histidine kinase [Actinomycetota bacterium]
MVAAIVGSLAFVGFAVLLAGSSSTSRAAADARSLHWVNATTAALSGTRASLSQAILFDLGADAGFTTDEAAARARDEADVSLSRAREWVAGAIGAGVDDPELIASLTGFLRGAEDVLGTLGTAGPEAADAAFAEQVEGPWASLEIELIARQQALAEAISDAEGFSGFVSALFRVLLLLVVPVGAILVYRILARREQRETRVRFEAELAAEQELGRQRTHFLAGVSHELRTPLTSVVGYSHLLLQGGLDRATAIELVQGIRGEADELSRMVEDLLVASRPEGVEVPLRIEDCDIGAEVQALTASSGRLGRTVNVRMEPATVRADAGRVRQIVRNLLSNADKHGGPTVWVTGAERTGEYVLMVADDGDGVGPERVGGLFEPYTNRGAAAVVSGSIGLGLSVARQLAKAMGGDLEYRRTGDWTQFLLRLPLGSGTGSAPGAGLPAGAWAGPES